MLAQIVPFVSVFPPSAWLAFFSSAHLNVTPPSGAHENHRFYRRMPLDATAENDRARHFSRKQRFLDVQANAVRRLFERAGCVSVRPFFCRLSLFVWLLCFRCARLHVTVMFIELFRSRKYSLSHVALLSVSPFSTVSCFTSRNLFFLRSVPLA